MSSYAEKLLALRARRAPVEIAWELREALEEKQGRGETLTPSEELALHVCLVSHCDGIADLLETSPGSVPIAADFARKRGLPKTAAILDDAAHGKPVGGPVVFGEGENAYELPFEKWAATDLMLSLAEEDIDAAVLDLVEENLADFVVAPPVETAHKDGNRARIAELARRDTPVALLEELLAHKKPRIRAQRPEGDRSGDASDWREVKATHRAEPAANAKVLAAARKRYGPAASALLDVYAAHDGAELFAVEGKPGLILVPVEQWPEHMESVMDWARNVTWSGEPDEIPDFLESSIPFGYTPGDSERWILVTQGEHAGEVMLSDTDVIDGEARFASIAEFLAALHVDMRSVIGSGGYISYEGGFYPEEYRGT